MRRVAVIVSILVHVWEIGSARSGVGTKPTIAGIALPTRRTTSLALRAREVATALAQLDHDLQLVVHDQPLDLSRPFGRAELLYSQARFDQSASVLDAALDQAAPIPHRIADPAALVSAMVKRISIAIARGESARSEELIARLLHYDPASALLPAEDDPRTHAALEVVRSKLGPSPPLGPDVLAELCRVAAVVIVARAVEAEGVEFIRYDRCRIVAQFRALTASDDVRAAAQLVVHSAERPLPGTAASRPINAAEPPRFARPMVVAGAATLGVGIAAITAGGVFFALAKSSSDELNRTPENAPYNADLDHELHRRQQIGAVSLALGATAAATGTVLLVIGLRPSHRTAPIAVTATGESIGVIGAF